MTNLDALAREMREHGLILVRLQSEIQGHLKDNEKPLKDFYRFVMDPETGVVVSVQRLDARLRILEETTMEWKGTKKWLLRDIIVGGLVSLAVALVTILAMKAIGA